MQPSAVQENTLLPRNPTQGSYPETLSPLREAMRMHRRLGESLASAPRPGVRSAGLAHTSRAPPPRPRPGPAPKGTDASAPQAGGPSTGQACPPPQPAQPCLHATRIQNACPTQPASAPSVILPDPSPKSPKDKDQPATGIWALFRLGNKRSRVMWVSSICTCPPFPAPS